MLAPVVLLLPVWMAGDVEGAFPLPTPFFKGGNHLEMDLEVSEETLAGETRYLPGKISLRDPQLGWDVTGSVLCRARGNTRRTQLNCQVPPLKLKIPEALRRGTPLEPYETLKMVTFCRQGGGGYETYYRQEYLIYRMYQLLSPYSLAVRAVRLKVHGPGNGAVREGLGFVVEPLEALALRTGLRTVDASQFNLMFCDMQMATTVAVFQFAMGNTDWSIRSRHNIEMLFEPRTKRYMPIPYDFDYSGIINAHYARVEEALGIKSVRDRLFRGHCQSMDCLGPVISAFLEKKNELEAVILQDGFLSEGKKTSMLRYLGDFYRILDNPSRVRQYFIQNNRGRAFPRPQ